jgi:beta-aspartyl-dipeptidase (metallo-type)
MRNSGWRRGGRGGRWNTEDGVEASSEADAEACHDQEACGNMLYEKTGSGMHESVHRETRRGTPAQWAALWCALGVLVITATSLTLAVVVMERDRHAQRDSKGAHVAHAASASSAPAFEAPWGPPPPRVKMPSFRPCTFQNDTQDAGLVLLRGGIVYAPRHLGRRHVLFGGGRVLRIFDEAAEVEADNLLKLGLVTLVDVTDRLIVPGFVDMHVHVTGGGGESGPESKVPESRLSDLFKGGLTTVVGILGTDSVSRTPVELLTKVNALNRSPMTAYMWTGAYKTLPEVPTVTGTVEKDIAFITPIIGTKTAISDHRSSQEDAAVLRNLVAQARVGGMLGGKAGLVYAHMGDGSAGLAPLFDVVDNTPIPITQMLPTHMGRTQQLVTEGVEWLTRGGAIDVTASSNAPNIIEQYNASVADMSRVSVSSDAYGSIPEYNAQKQLVGYDYARPDRLLAFLRTMVLSRNHDVADVLALMTENPARTLQVPKGRIEVGADADLLVLEPQSLEVVYSVARGMPVLTPECVAKDLFEH